MPYSLSIPTLFKKKYKNALPQLLQNDALIGIIICYAYKYSVEKVNFCNYFYLQTMTSLQTQSRKKSQELVKKTQGLLQTIQTTTQLVEQSAKKIEDRILQITQANKLESELNLASQQHAVKESHLKNVHVFHGTLETCALEIRNQSANLHQALEDVRKDVLRKFNSKLEETLQTSKESGFIFYENQEQKKFNQVLKNVYKELEGEDFFYEIHQILALLEDFPLCIDDAIHKKKNWENRFHLQSHEKLIDDILFVLLGLGALFGIGLIAMTFIVPMSIILSIYLILVGSALLLALVGSFQKELIPYDEGGPERFEKHVLKSSFPSLVENLEEIKQMIRGIQVLKIHDSSETKEEHPLLKLNGKSKVQDIRQAIQGEYTFFKKIYEQSPSQQVIQDESSLSVIL
ncbi:MAG: hypothetical protein H0U75_02245 [Legionella sp.]|nr:hypothetical protein [Legionella sp.]